MSRTEVSSQEGEQGEENAEREQHHSDEPTDARHFHGNLDLARHVRVYRELLLEPHHRHEDPRDVLEHRDLIDWSH